ncbi:uncharacterized protein LOC142570436 [Dermacentor variabilis]|uniref:uncharacterized protein LOC142570436 n=1 Tax=Dermacentor variabilis TaxID=34621 RepID=UPI003F5BFCB6
MQNLRQELTAVKKRSEDNEGECQRLRKSLGDLKKDLVELKQYSRRNNIELKGVPETENENLNDTVQKVAKCLKLDLSASDIDIAHRVPVKGSGLPNIIMKFNSRCARDKFFKAAKKNRLNTKMIGFEDNDPIFVNDHLCPENKILLGKTIHLKKEKGWKFAWVSNGKILARKADNSKVVHVTCEDDLSKIV